LTLVSVSETAGVEPSEIAFLSPSKVQTHGGVCRCRLTTKGLWKIATHR
jgi:hypothetical protein